jgi:acetyl esterase
MCEKMKAAGNLCEVFTIDGGGHGMGGWEGSPDRRKYKVKMIEWLKATL